MEEFLPLIIGFIWLAYTWYNKNQKKKLGKDGQPGTTKKQPSILEQLISGEPVQFSDSDPVYEETEEFEEFEPIAMVEENEKTTPFLSSELANFMEEGQSAFNETYDDDYNQDVDDEAELVYETLAEFEDFDLKKAVILSEILNAPYIDYK